MKVHEQLVKHYSIDELRERQNGISIAIDKAKGPQLTGLRKRYWTLEKAIAMKRRDNGIKAIIKEGRLHEY